MTPPSGKSKEGMVRSLGGYSESQNEDGIPFFH